MVLPNKNYLSLFRLLSQNYNFRLDGLQRTEIYFSEFGGWEVQSKLLADSVSGENLTSWFIGAHLLAVSLHGWKGQRDLFVVSFIRTLITFTRAILL